MIFPIVERIGENKKKREKRMKKPEIENNTKSPVSPVSPVSLLPGWLVTAVPVHVDAATSPPVTPPLDVPSVSSQSVCEWEDCTPLVPFAAKLRRAAELRMVNPNIPIHGPERKRGSTATRVSRPRPVATSQCPRGCCKPVECRVNDQRLDAPEDPAGRWFVTTCEVCGRFFGYRPLERPKRKKKSNTVRHRSGR